MVDELRHLHQAPRALHDAPPRVVAGSRERGAVFEELLQSQPRAHLSADPRLSGADVLEGVLDAGSDAQRGAWLRHPAAPADLEADPPFEHRPALLLAGMQMRRHVAARGDADLDDQVLA